MPKELLNKKSYNTLELVKDCWFLLEGKRVSFILYSFILVLSNLMLFLIAYLLGNVVDFFVTYKNGDSLTPFYFFVIGILFAGVFQTYSRFFVKWRIYFISGEIRMKARILAMTKLADLELKWHEKEETGSKIQKIASGGDSINSAFKFYVDSGIPILTGIIGGIIALSFMNFKYVLFSIGYILVYLYGEYYFNRKIAYFQDQMNIIKEKVSGKIHESASNILTVKTLGLKENLRKSVENYEKEYFDMSLNVRAANHNKFRTTKIFSAIMYAGFVFMLGLDTISGLISVGSIIIFLGYFDRIKGALDNVTNTLSDFIEIKSGVGRIMTILDKRTIEKESYPYKDILPNWRTISFNNVSFKYKDKWVLRHFNLNIKKGEKIGVVGGSGEGKSTVLKLLMGLYEPQEGSITIGNLSISKAKHSSLTKTVTAILQDSEMFNLPLKENISIGSNRFNEFLFNTAIRTSELTDFIKKLPNGVDTLIGEKGYKLSGGERQRVGIARAIYKDSDIFILDEATSHLDSKTESLIQSNTKKFLEDKTVITIAHRLSTLRDMDRIIVIENGKIVEEGKFDTLVRKKGKFFELWEKQRNVN